MNLSRIIAVLKHLSYAWAFVIVLGFFAFIGSQIAFSAPPENFQVSQIVGSGLDALTGMEIAPDGRIFLLERSGAVKIVKNGELLATPFVTFDVIDTGDRGLIGITFDPDYDQNKYVYFYYTGRDELNRIVRYSAETDTATNGPLIVYQTEIPSPLLHVGGAIAFGPDKKMYVAVGDNGRGENAQELDNPHGKILRINKDGSIPSDNPFFGQQGVEERIWAYGLRNPWRFQFDSVSGKLYAGDVGGSDWEEVNVIKKGANYGWPLVEGPCTNCPYENALFSYPHNGQSSALTAGPVYRGSMFPEEYQGSYFFGDYARGFIRRLKLNPDGTLNSDYDFDLNAGSVTDLKVARDGSIYYITYWPGRLYRITYSVDNQLPIANATADKTKGVEPFTVQFSSKGSSDPDGEPLTFNWDFGNGTNSTEANPTKTYTEKGTYTVQLTVSDGQNSSQAVPIVIQVGTPPTVTIATPKEGDNYQAGDTIRFNVFATDGAGFDINDANIETVILFHHDTHTHPFAGPITGREGQFTNPIDNAEKDPDVWYELITTATDTSGLSTTKSVNVYPLKSKLTFQTEPAGLSIYLDGRPFETPQTIESVEKLDRELYAPVIQEKNGKYYQLDKWSNGGLLKQTLSTPVDDTTITAYFTETTPFKAEYYNNMTLSGTPAVTRNETEINYNWGQTSPVDGVRDEQFSARWTKTQNFKPGEYKFVVGGDDGVRLKIDGNTVIDKWIDQSYSVYNTTVTLSGNQTITLEYFENSYDARVDLSWEPIRLDDLPKEPTPTPTEPPPSGGEVFENFNAEYFDNKTLSGTPKVTRVDNNINFDWNLDSPAPSIPKDQFSTRWTKTMDFTGGTYEFKATVDDGIRIYVDNQLVLDKWFDQPTTDYTVEKNIAAGQHVLKIEYYENYIEARAIVTIANKGGTPPEEPEEPPVNPPTDSYQAKFWNVPGTGRAPEIPTRAPDVTREDSAIDFDWNQDSPATGINKDNFIAQWVKSETFEEGEYTFTTISDDGVRVYIDNQLVINEWNDHSTTTNTGKKTLSAGTHVIKVEFYDNTVDARIKMTFAKDGTTPPEEKPPVEITGFKGEYFNNRDLSGTPTLVRDDDKINFIWAEESPGTGINKDNFSARWTKKQTYAAGTYEFMLTADDGIRFYIDDVLILDEWKDQPTTTYLVSVPLLEGEHTLRIEYYERWVEATAIFEQR